MFNRLREERDSIKDTILNSDLSNHPMDAEFRQLYKLRGMLTTFNEIIELTIFDIDEEHVE